MTTSPLLTGGAGFDFEDGVAAVYLTALSLEGGVLGLGQFTATPIALQRAGSGAPLDDVIVTGVDVAGDSSTLHLQVKFPGGDWGAAGIAFVAAGTGQFLRSRPQAMKVTIPSTASHWHWPFGIHWSALVSSANRESCPPL